MVNLAGVQQSVSHQVIQNLPKIVQIEICHPKLNENSDLGKQLRFQTTNRIISMLDVRFLGDTADEREQDKALAMSEFGTFLRSFNLTSQEVIEAYRMALARELNYKVYPTLSLIQAGEILELYQEFKRNSHLRNSALEKLKRSFKTPKIEDSSEKERNEIGTLRRIYDELKSKGFSEESHILFSDLEKKGKLRNWDKSTKKRFFSYVKKKFIEEKRIEARSGKLTSTFARKMLKNNDLINSLVRSRCREILVCDYLIKHLQSFELFVKSIKND